MRASMAEVRSRALASLIPPPLTVHDVAEIDSEVRAALTEVGNDDDDN
jgi:hypothetical protein